MKYFIIAVGMLAGIFISVIVGFALGHQSFKEEHSHPDPLPRSVETVESDLESEMLKSNAMLDGLHWFLIKDKALWDTAFVNSIEYKTIDKMVIWGNFYNVNWNAKVSLEYDNFVRTHY